jgi:hypothetical protein
VVGRRGSGGQQWSDDDLGAVGAVGAPALPGLARETRGRFQRPLTWWYFGLSIAVTGTILVAALFTLSGSLEPSQSLRDNLATLLLIQFGVSLVVTIYDAARRRDVEEAEAAAKAEAVASATATASTTADKRRRRSNR